MTLAALLSVGCTSGEDGRGGAGRAPQRRPYRVVALESNVLRVPRETNGAAFSSLLQNLGSTPVTVTDVATIADPGLRVTYLGVSTCARGCAGSSHWRGNIATRVERGLDAVLPFTLRRKRSSSPRPSASTSTGRAEGSVCPAAASVSAAST